MTDIGLILYTLNVSDDNTQCVGVHGYVYEVIDKPKGSGLNKYYLTENGYLQKINKNKTVHTVVSPLEYIDYKYGSYEIDNAFITELKSLVNILSKLDNYKINNIVLHTRSKPMLTLINKKLISYNKNKYARNGELIPFSNLFKKTYKLIGNLLPGSVKVIEYNKDLQSVGYDKAKMCYRIGTAYLTNGEQIDEVTLSNFRGYWKPKIDRHPALKHKSMIFVTGGVRKKGFYFLSTYKDKFSDGAGCKSNETSYTVLITKEPQKLLEDIIEYSNYLYNGEVMVCDCHIDTLHNSSRYPVITNNHRKVLTKKDGGLIYVDGEHIVSPISPPNRVYEALRTCDILYELLSIYNHTYLPNNVVHNKTIDVENIEILDITNIFYKTNDKGKNILDPIYIVGYSKQSIRLLTKFTGAKKIKVNLSLGADLPHRNTLKKIENIEPKINLVIWRVSEFRLRVATIVETNDSISCWSNYYADSIYFN